MMGNRRIAGARRIGSSCLRPLAPLERKRSRPSIPKPASPPIPSHDSGPVLVSLARRLGRAVVATACLAISQFASRIPPTLTCSSKHRVARHGPKDFSDAIRHAAIGSCGESILWHCEHCPAGMIGTKAVNPATRALGAGMATDRPAYRVTVPSAARCTPSSPA